MISPDPRLDFTGERLIPDLNGGQLLYVQHFVRYVLAAQFVRDRNVLDAACGAGYGSELLASAGARSVMGIDLAPEAASYAAARYRREPQLRFIAGDMRRLPVPDRSFDMAVCFEGIEHIERGDQPLLISECRRVLREGGIFMVSTPNPRTYTAGNPFHKAELSRNEFEALLAPQFAHVRILFQKDWICSAILNEQDMGLQSVDRGLDLHTRKVAGAPAAECRYFVAICSDRTLDEYRGTGVLTTDLQQQQAHIARQHAQLETQRAIISHYKENEHRLLEAQTMLANTNSALVAEHKRAVDLLVEVQNALITAGEAQGEVRAERQEAIALLSKEDELLERLVAALHKLAAERRGAWRRLIDWLSGS